MLTLANYGHWHGKLKCFFFQHLFQSGQGMLTCWLWSTIDIVHATRKCCCFDHLFQSWWGVSTFWLWSTSDNGVQSWNAASFVVYFRTDGACQHVALAAGLYAADDQAVKSVTDGPAVWVHRKKQKRSKKDEQPPTDSSQVCYCYSISSSKCCMIFCSTTKIVFLPCLAKKWILKKCCMNFIFLNFHIINDFFLINILSLWESWYLKIVSLVLFS